MSSHSNPNQPIFPNSVSMGFREWGSEDLLCFVKDHFTLKKIHISAGKKGGLQYHRLKNEAGLIIEGELKVIFQNTEGSLISKVLKPGDVLTLDRNQTDLLDMFVEQAHKFNINPMERAGHLAAEVKSTVAIRLPPKSEELMKLSDMMGLDDEE